MKNSKKILALLLAVIMLVTCFAGCGKKDADASDTAGTTKDTVVVAISSEITSLDPIDGWGHGNTPLIQSTLMQYNYDMTFKYDLAKEYTLDDFIGMKFRLLNTSDFFEKTDKTYTVDGKEYPIFRDGNWAF